MKIEDILSGMMSDNDDLARLKKVQRKELLAAFERLPFICWRAVVFIKKEIDGSSTFAPFNSENNLFKIQGLEMTAAFSLIQGSKFLTSFMDVEKIMNERYSKWVLIAERIDNEIIIISNFDSRAELIGLLK